MGCSIAGRILEGTNATNSNHAKFRQSVTIFTQSLNFLFARVLSRKMPFRIFTITADNIEENIDRKE